MLTLGSSRQRALLAALALADGHVVSVEALAGALWGDDPPDGLRGTLQTYVSRLRATLGRDVIAHEPGGYRLHAATDLGVVEALAAEARSLAAHDPRAAVRCLDDALGRWRGPALGDLADDPWFVPDAVRIAELRRSLVDDRLEALLRAGDAVQVLPDAERHAAAEPLRERTQLLLVEALAATGRAAEALRAADRYRRRLAEETGLDPGPALAELEQRILVDPGAGAAPAPRRTGLRRSRSLSRPAALVGRDAELAALRAEVAENRLVTVLGPGGVGKTRLVAELLDGAEPHVVVELAGTSADDVPAALADALGIGGAPADLLDAAGEHLSVEPVLLVLDNCEHVAVAAARAVRRLLDAAPGLRVLTTSRTRLGLPDESVFALEPLATDGADAPAVQLLLDRLRRAAPGPGAQPDPEAAAALARALDGIPLALELAAGRAAVLGLEPVLQRLDDVLDLVAGTGIGPERHATLRAVVGSSYELLEPVEQEVLDALGAFHGDATLDAIEAVIGFRVPGPVAATVARLVDASLVAALPDGRLRVLDTVRRFAHERLATRPWADEVHAAHTRWVVALVEDVAASAAGPAEAAADTGMRTHVHDVRAALHRIVETGDADAAARVAAALATFVVYRPEGELVAWLRRAADVPALAGPEVRAGAARAAYLQGDLAAVDAYADGIDLPVAHHARGVAALYRGAHPAALDEFAAALEHDDIALPVRLDVLAGAALTQCYAGDLAGAQATMAGHRALADSAGSITYAAFADYVCGEIALAGGDLAGAVPLLESAVSRAGTVRAGFTLGVASTALLSATVRLGDTAAALRAASTLVEHWWRSATWPQQWTTLRLAAGLLVEIGRADVAALVLAAADADDAAPAVVGEDADRVAAVRRRIDEQLGVPAARAVFDAARTIPRAVVVQRARDVLQAAASGA